MHNFAMYLELSSTFYATACVAELTCIKHCVAREPAKWHTKRLLFCKKDIKRARGCAGFNIRDVIHIFKQKQAVDSTTGLLAETVLLFNRVGDN